MDGEALIGSVSDDPYDIRTFLRLAKPAGKHAHIGTELISTTEHTLTERGYFAHPGETTRGINDRGLAFICAMVFEKEMPGKNPQAQLYTDLTRTMMSQRKTVVDAIDLFRTAGSTAPAYSVLLADAHGDHAHPEVGSYGVMLPWGTVSAEIMQPSRKLFWYAYGWPCGQTPEYGDQIYQGKSWGKFVPFGFAGSDREEREITILSTVEDVITHVGSRNRT